MRKCDIIKKMENIIKRRVKHYRSDFYDYDKPAMESCGNKYNFLWIVRECGTWLLDFDDAKTDGSNASIVLNYYAPDQPDNDNAVLYKICNGSFKKVDYNKTLNELRRI